MKRDKLMNSGSIIQDLEGSNLGFGSHETFMNAINFETEITTISLLKIHILRLVLIFNWSLYAYFKEFYGFLVEFTQTLNIVYNILSINIFHVEKFIQLVAKLVVLMYLNVDQNSLNILFEFLPKPEALPNSIALILKLQRNPIPTPPEIPQPFLDYDKKLVVPNEIQVSEAFRLRNEYFTHQRLFVVSEKFRMMNELSKFILWSSLSNIEFINIYEPSGILWGNTEALDIVRQCIISEITSQLKLSPNEKSLRNLVPIIQLIDINLGIELEININESKCTQGVQHASSQLFTDHLMEHPFETDGTGPTEEVVIENDEQDWIDDVRIRKFKVYFSDKNIQDLRNLPIFSELILIPSSDDLKLLGFITSMEHNETVLYSTENKFDFKTFVKGLHYFANSIANKK